MATERLPIEFLHHPHRESLIRAIANVLASPIAIESLAQIVDGLPLASVTLDRYQSGSICSGHPLLEEHQELCPGVAEEARQLCCDFHVGSLLLPLGVGIFPSPPGIANRPLTIFSLQLLHDYESVPVSSSGRSARLLIELVARSVHQIAAWLYRQDLSRHKDDALGMWRPSGVAGRVYPATFPASLFCHPWYPDHDQYPGGIADSVGYWAEARILGGVILFDRRDPELVSEAEVCSSPRPHLSLDRHYCKIMC